MHLEEDTEMAAAGAMNAVVANGGEEEEGEASSSSSFIMADPFLALQNDLDDVSEVIKHNLVADEQLSGANSPTPEPAKVEMEMSPHLAAAGGSGCLPSEFIDQDPSRERQIGQIMHHLLQQPENNNQVPPAQAGFDHLQLSPMAAATNSPNSLIRYPFGQLDPMIGGGGNGSPAGSHQQLHFLQRADFGQSEMMSMVDSPEHGQPGGQQPPQFQFGEENGWSLHAAAQIGHHHHHGHQFSAQMSIEDESPPPVEPNFGGNFAGGGGIKQEMLLMEQQRRPNGGGHQSAAIAAKNDLIRMLLEMSPEELEHLRVSRARQAQATMLGQSAHQQQMAVAAYPPPQQIQPIFIQTGPPSSHHHHPMFLQQQSPPLDPPPPLAQFQMEFGGQHPPPPQQPQHFPHQFCDGSQFIEFTPIPVQSGAQFYPSPTGSAALTSPISNGAFPSLAPSEFLEDESAMEEIWTDGEMLGGNGEEGEEEEEEEDGGGEGGGRQHGGRRRGHKTERRTAHNLIEKKYRCSINDRINQLKTMLATEEQQKLSKSATLRRAVDHILALRSKNAELMGENARLRQTLEIAGVAPPPAPQTVTMRIKQQQQQENGQRTAGPNNKNPRGRVVSTRKPTASAAVPVGPSGGRGDHSRVTLCVFMFLLLAFNPLAVFLSSSGDALDQHEEATFASHHRTLAADDQYNGQFSNQGPALVQQPPASRQPFSPTDSGGGAFWAASPWLRQLLIWLLNSLFVFAILNRLLVSGEPVADRRSPRWGAFLQTRRKAAQAVAAGNWKEAQRQLDESLQLLDRPLPSSGGLDEWMSLTWQIIRHLLNVLWIGRWFARRRRPSIQSQKSICRSHAATAMVYHQLHQLHLLGVDGIGLTQGGALNLALLAANLAESAGSAAISHALRAEIYACAALRCRLCMPKWLRRIISGYFFRRAKRHVSKSQRLQATEMNSLQWLFHPLARRFLAEPGRLGAILGGSGAQRTPNFPFSDSAQSPKPVEVLRDAFKMHLLDGLLVQVDSEGTFRVADFVEQSQLLLQICTADNGWNGAGRHLAAGSSQSDEDREENYEQALFDLLSPNGSIGDELCNWWAHLLSGALHWRHGDLARARQHCAIVRKCPKELGQNDLALAVGLAFCSRKICLEDRRKGAWAEMVLLHTQRAFAHLRRADRHCQWREVEQQGQGTLQIQRRFRLVCCHWLLSSLLDLCSFSIGPGQEVPLEVRRLYSGVMARMEREGIDGMEPKKLSMFKHLGETLCGIVFLLDDEEDGGHHPHQHPSIRHSPAPSSIGSSASTLGLPSQQRRKTTIEVLRGGPMVE